MHLILIVLLLIFSLCDAGAAENAPLGIVSGTLVDSTTKQPISYVYASLTQKVGSSVYTALTDDKGAFEFKQLPAGTYLLNFSSVGYNKKPDVVVEVGDKLAHVKLPQITLAPTVVMLKETEVVAAKSAVKVEAGKMTFDTEKNVINQSGTAIEVLQNIPTVTVDQNGNTSVKGKSGVRFLIDGKPAPASFSDPGSFLKSIPASSIANIELITNPGAKYDAAGSAAIINIKLKKNKNVGTNGSISGSVGTLLNKYNLNTTLNHRNKFVNVFGNYSFSSNIFRPKWEETRYMHFRNEQYYFYNLNKGVDHDQNHSVKVGIDGYIRQRHTLSFTSTVNVSDGNAPWKTLNERYSNSDVLETVSYTNSRYKSRNINAFNILSYQYEQDSGKVKWTADVMHTHFIRNSDNDIRGTFFDAFENEDTSKATITRNRFQTLVDNFTAQTDGDIKFGGNAGSMQIGLKNETNLSRNDNNTTKTKGGVETQDTASYLFKYYENIAAVYFTYSNQFGKVGINIGCRGEHTYVTSATSSVRQNYVSFFPNASISIEGKKDQSFALAFSRRIDRPNFYQLNNFRTQYDQYTQEEGNPNLRPQFTYIASFDYSKQIKKSSVYASLSTNLTNALMEQISYVDESGIMHLKWVNAGSYNTLSFDLGTNVQVKKFWSFSINTNYNHSFFNANLSDTIIKKNGGVFSLYTNHTFTLPLSFKIQLQGNFNTGYVFVQGISKPGGQLDVTVSKNFLKDKLTLSVSCRDVFNTNWWKGESSSPSFHNRGLWKPESRIGYLTLSYRFGSMDGNKARRTVQNDRLRGGGGR
jgi:iron complex outermembrane receptor protein